jgi:predicted alpha-1,2-mannosidase
MNPSLVRLGRGASSVRRRHAILATLAAFAFAGAAVGHAQSARASASSAVDAANPLVGTAPLDRQALIGNAPPPGEPLYPGMTSPGARLPQSSTETAPVNVNVDLSYPTGVATSYDYRRPAMIGFTGGGGSTYGGRGSPMIMPVVGDWTMPPDYTPSYYDKASEKASPGYYAVDLATFHTRVELTATQWTSLMRFAFPASKRSNVVINVRRPGGEVEVVGDRTIRGMTADGEAAHDSNGPWFVAEFSRPFAVFGTFRANHDHEGYGIGGQDVQAGRRTVSGSYAGAYVTFETKAGEQVLVKIAHGHSAEEAEQRLRDEDPGWNFERVHAQARAAWAKVLDRVEVTGGTPRQRMLFYSTLYHSFASPRLLARKGERFTDANGKVQVAAYDRYGPVPFWDTGRNQIALLMLLEPQVVQDIMHSELDMARERGYMNTSFHGDHAVFLYDGAWQRGIPFDYVAAYAYLRKNATDPNGPRGYLAEYMKSGWIADIVPPGNPSPPYAGGKAGVATTLEYAWDDHALADVARRLGRTDDARMFLRRAANYRHVFDPSVGFFRGRTSDVRPGRAVLQLHDEGSLGLVYAVAGAARRAGPDRSARRARRLQRQARRVLLHALPLPRHLPRLHRHDRAVRAGQSAGPAGGLPLCMERPALEDAGPGAPHPRRAVRQRRQRLRLSRHGRPGLDLILVCAQRNGLLSGRSLQPGLHARQSDLRPRSPAHGQRQDLRDRRAQQLGPQQIHPVRNARRQAVDQAMVQPRRHRERRHAGADDGT